MLLLLLLQLLLLLLNRRFTAKLFQVLARSSNFSNTFFTDVVFVRASVRRHFVIVPIFVWVSVCVHSAFDACIEFLVEYSEQAFPLTPSSTPRHVSARASNRVVVCCASTARFDLFRQAYTVVAHCTGVHRPYQRIWCTRWNRSKHTHTPIRWNDAIQLEVK